MSDNQQKHIIRCDQIIDLGGILTNDDQKKYDLIKKQFKEANKIDFHIVMMRLKCYLDLHEDQQLASFIGMKPQTLYARKSTLSIPYEHIIKALHPYCQKENNLLRHIFYGENL